MSPIKQPDPALAKAADAQCRTVDEAILSAAPLSLTGPPKTAADFDTVTRSYAKSNPVLVASADSLRAPKSSNTSATSAYERFLAAYLSRVTVSKQQQAAAAKHDSALFQKLGQTDERYQKAETKWASQLGLDLCGQAGTVGV